MSENNEFEDNPILDSVRARLWRKNKNWIAAIVGGVGSGKSWSALSIAEYIDRNFTVDNVFFSIKDFVTAIDENKIKKGSCAVIDEAGVQWGSRDFMRQHNRDMSYLFQVMRFLNFGLIMTTPSLYLIDKHGRDITHAVFKTKGISYETGVCKLEVKIIDFNPMTGKSYPKFPRIIVNGEKRKADIMEICKPGKELVRDYEKKKKEFATGLVREIRGRMDAQPKQRDIKKPAILADIVKGKLSTTDLAKKHDVSKRYVFDIKEMMKNK